MRIVSLNIRQGGGSRIDRILNSLYMYDSDTIILCEFRHNSNGQKLQTHLNQIGFKYFAAGNTEHPNNNTVSIFSKSRFELGPSADVLGINSHRVIEAVFQDFTLVSVYFPIRERKKPVFDYLIDYCIENQNERVAIIGDFNTGKHFLDEPGSDFICEEYIHKIEALGWIDGWRMFHSDKREYTWYSNKGNGFRIDHIFCTQAFTQALQKVDYSHKIREEKLTDHSSLLVETLILQQP